MSFLDTTWKKAAAGIIAIVLLVFLYNRYKKEGMVGIYLDQIANQSTNPIMIKYFGRVKDNLGWSPKDYYLENDQNYRMGNDVRFWGDSEFVNQQDYSRPMFGRLLFNRNLSNYGSVVV